MIYKSLKDLPSIKTLILDLDNCLFDSREWNKYIPSDKYSREGWDLFHKHIDKVIPNLEMVDYVLDLIENKGLEQLYFVTSRENIDNTLDITLKQIYKTFGIHKINKIKYGLYMRKAHDYRPPNDIKQEIVKTEILPNTDIDLAIDDDISNIEMYQGLGIDSLHYTKFIV